MWIVQLQYNGCDGAWSKVICGCASEEAAHAAGKKLAAYYNYPDLGYVEGMAGVIIFSMIEYYGYAVKYHEGEWING